MTTGLAGAGSSGFLSLADDELPLPVLPPEAVLLPEPVLAVAVELPLAPEDVPLPACGALAGAAAALAPASGAAATGVTVAAGGLATTGAGAVALGNGAAMPCTWVVAAAAADCEPD